jgi:hypothetical protein
MVRLAPNSRGTTNPLSLGKLIQEKINDRKELSRSNSKSNKLKAERFGKAKENVK